MNFKKLIATVLVGASLLVFAGIASATTYDINVYGASAQYTFWNYLATVFIQSQSGCSSTTPTVLTNNGTGTSAVNQITFATCGGNTYNIRVSNKASFDGVLAVLGNDQYATAGAAAEKCSAGDPNYPGSSSPYYRKMLDSDGVLRCNQIMVGASDVAGESFDQYSWGMQHGPQGNPNTGAQITRNIGSINTSTLAHANPFVVPFSFYVNNTVKEGGVTIDNLTRLQAVLLFSGKIMNWNQFGAGFANQTTAICFRHAGSGTHATLDYAVVRGNGWGGTLAQNENRPDDTIGDYVSSLPTMYFNDTTGDEQYCVDNEPGAVGYYDSDKASFTTHLVSGYPNTVQVAYQGEYASADGVKNARCDFYTNEWAYKSNSIPSGDITIVNNFLSYAAGNIPPAETSFWVDQTQMTHKKATDKQYPQ